MIREETACSALTVMCAEVSKVELVTIFGEGTSDVREVFRFHFAEGMTVDLPVDVLSQILTVARSSMVIPHCLLVPDADGVIASVERLAKAIEADRADRPAPLLAAA